MDRQEPHEQWEVQSPAPMNNPRHQYMLKAIQLESRLAEKELGMLVYTWFSTSERHALGTKKVYGVYGCIRQSVISSL